MCVGVSLAEAQREVTYLMAYGSQCLVPFSSWLPPSPSVSYLTVHRSGFSLFSGFCCLILQKHPSYTKGAILELRPVVTLAVLVLSDSAVSEYVTYTTTDPNIIVV